MSKKTHAKAVVMQAAPVPLAIDHGITQMVELVADAADVSADLVAFGESFLGGYPIWLDEAPGAAIWDHRGTQALHAILLDQAIRPNDPRLRPLQQIVDKSGMLVSVGAHVRVRSTIQNAQVLLRPFKAPMIHRKLVPTHGERMLWGRGDGSTLEVHEAEWGKVGQLMCWEHWMPFARAALHHEGEQIHIASWPTVRDIYKVASMHYAFEGRCFVLAAGTILHRNDLLEGLDRVGGDADARDLLMQLPDQQLQFGNSLIVGPDGAIHAAAEDSTDMLIHDCDMSEIARGLTALDTDGHFSRPDVFELRIDRRPKHGVADMEDGLKPA